MPRYLTQIHLDHYLSDIWQTIIRRRRTNTISDQLEEKRIWLPSCSTQSRTGWRAGKTSSSRSLGNLQPFSFTFCYHSDPPPPHGNISLNFPFLLNCAQNSTTEIQNTITFMWSNWWDITSPFLNYSWEWFWHTNTWKIGNKLFWIEKTPFPLSRKYSLKKLYCCND